MNMGKICMRYQKAVRFKKKADIFIEMFLLLLIIHTFEYPFPTITYRTCNQRTWYQ